MTAPDAPEVRGEKPVFICQFYANNGEEGKGKKRTAISWDGAPSPAYVAYVKQSAYEAMRERAEAAESNFRGAMEGMLCAAQDLANANERIAKLRKALEFYSEPDWSIAGLKDDKDNYISVKAEYALKADDESEKK